MPNNYLSVLYKYIIQVENKNVGLKVGGTNIPLPPPPSASYAGVYIYIYIFLSMVQISVSATLYGKSIYEANTTFN